MTGLANKCANFLCLIISVGPLTAQADHVLSALSGDKIRVYDGVMSLQGVRCPGLETEAGKEAKRLANIYLHGAHVYCEIAKNERGNVIGDCKLRSNNGNNLSQMLIASGYCKEEKLRTKCDTTTRLLFQCGT